MYVPVASILSLSSFLRIYCDDDDDDDDDGSDCLASYDLVIWL